MLNLICGGISVFAAIAYKIDTRKSVMIANFNWALAVLNFAVFLWNFVG